MENPLYIALSQQVALRRSVDLIANNVANASTAGFRAEHLKFSEVLLDNADGVKMSFVQDAGVVRDFREGQFSATGKPFDVAIHGKGWLVVDTALGLRYTRAGQFHLDAASQLVNADGDPVLGENGAPIVFQQDDHDIKIGVDGTIHSGRETRGQLLLVRFDDETALSPVSGGLYQTTAPSAPATGVKVAQGMIETSNVRPVIEIVDLMTALRNYQATQQFIDAENRRQTMMIESLTKTT